MKMRRVTICSDRTIIFVSQSIAAISSGIPADQKMGQYVRLEFAYLVDLAGIDRVLRDLILGMALDIEHLAKWRFCSWWK